MFASEQPVGEPGSLTSTTFRRGIRSAVMDVSRLIELRVMEARGSRMGYTLRVRPEREDKPGRYSVPEGVASELAAVVVPPSPANLEGGVRFRFDLDRFGRGGARSGGEVGIVLAGVPRISRSRGGCCHIAGYERLHILFLMGRVNLRRSVRRGQIGLDGDMEVAARFGSGLWGCDLVSVGW